MAIAPSITLTSTTNRQVRAITIQPGQPVGFGRTTIAKQLSIAFIEEGSEVAAAVLKCATVACVSGTCEFRPYPDTEFRIPAQEARRLAEWATAQLHPAP